MLAEKIFSRRELIAETATKIQAPRINVCSTVDYPRLSPQKRPMVITSKPATGQVFGTTVSTPLMVAKATTVLNRD
jgi:hypothetical protein